MSNPLTKREVERLTAALDERDNEDKLQRTARLRDAAAPALAILVGRDLPSAELVDAAATIGSWSPARVRALQSNAVDTDETIDALYDLITELNETRRL